METIISIIVSLITGYVISKYFFRRSLNKRLSIYLLMNNRVFSGIDKTVRGHLKFIFNDKEIVELQQVELIVANDGDLAISNCIEPLRLTLPNSVKLLDASILHRNPNELKVTIVQKENNSDGCILEFNTALLNKGDYFYLKLLLDGKLLFRDMDFQILAEGLPRRLKPDWLPANSSQLSERKVEWGAVLMGAMIMFWGFLLAKAMWSKYVENPSIFPYPWNEFVFGSASIWVFIGALGSIALELLGVTLALAVGLEGVIMRSIRFALPDELRGRVTLYSDVKESLYFEQAEEQSASTPNE